MGSQNFSPIKGEQLEKNRLAARDGRVDRELRTRTIIPARYAEEVWANPDNILGMPYLVADLKGFKKVLKALKKVSSHDPDAATLHRKLTLQSPGEEFTSPLCPVARHQRKREMVRGLDRFLFQAAHNQFSFDTVVHGFSPTLEGTLDVKREARADFRVIQQTMIHARTGYLEVGTFEPDIRHIDDFEGGKPSLSRLADELAWDIPDTGGYVVTSHRLVRVAHPSHYREVLRQQFPGYRRTKSERFDKSKSLVENIKIIVDYLWKLEPHVNAIRMLPEKDCPRIMQSVFAGPTVTGKHRNGYVRDHMIAQWALFQDRIGFAPFEINYVNQFAYDWFSKSEIELFLEYGHYDKIHGYCNVEPNRRLYNWHPKRSDRHAAMAGAQTTAPKPHRLRATLDSPPDVPEPEIIAVIAGEPVIYIER